MLSRVPRFAFSKKGIIFTYHSIDSSGSPISIHPDVFKWQMAHLKHNGRKGVSVGEYLSKLRACPQNHSQLVALTFDDGFENFHQVALPVLRRHGFSATVFAVTGHVGKSCSWEKRSGIPNLKLMDWQHLRECLVENVEIGSHTMGHPHLVLLNRSSMEMEIRGSKEMLEDHLQTEVTTFCYPYGNYNSNVRSLVQQSGYLAAVTCRFAHHRWQMNSYELPRLGMNRIDSTDHKAQRLHLKAALVGASPLYHRLKRIGINSGKYL